MNKGDVKKKKRYSKRGRKREIHGERKRERERKEDKYLFMQL